MKDKLTLVLKDNDNGEISRTVLHCNYSDIRVIHSTRYNDGEKEVEAIDVDGPYFYVSIEKDENFKELLKDFNKSDLLKGKIMLFDIEKQSLGIDYEVECTVMIKKEFIKGMHKTDIQTASGRISGTKYFAECFNDYILIDE